MKKHQRLGLKKNFKTKIAIIGVGYVGLPLAKHLSKFFLVKAYDIEKSRIKELNKGIDRNLDFKKKELKNKNLTFTHNYEEIKNSNVFIITLPTPINKRRIPDISLVIKATEKLCKVIKKNDLIIYESTFYPGTIEDKIIPILEKNSKFKLNQDFFIGYSPERINPGEKIHTINKVKKVIAGSNEYALRQIREIYNKVVKPGLCEASSIKVAELSKILENTQRFVNIALMNEISTLCNKINIQTKEVIEVASTKWNFMKFYPGFVGGHCVAVDPLYLSYKQKKLNLKSYLVDAADQINETKHLEVVNFLSKNLKKLKKKRILILGVTFKENCPDLRNSGVMNLIKTLNKSKIKPYIHDPYLQKKIDKKEFNMNYIHLKKLKKISYDCIILAVPHDFYKKIGLKKLKKISKNKKCLILDVKSVFNKNKVDFQL